MSQDVDASHKPDDMTTQEVVQLSKLPDAHQPSDDEIPAIERADWPAPPHPAAAYPELCMYIALPRVFVTQTVECSSVLRRRLQSSLVVCFNQFSLFCMLMFAFVCNSS